MSSTASNDWINVSLSVGQPVKKTSSQNFWPRINSINWLIESARSTVFFVAASAAKFWKLTLVGKSISGFFWRYFWLLNFLQKEVFKYTRIHSLFVNGVVTASNHALWRVLSNKVIWVYRHVKICRLWHSPSCRWFLINCFGIEMVLCDHYFHRQWTCGQNTKL